ncbi:MAG TPA: hypothetical protein VGX68_28465 [Thermoanaerobaculia bacterium]|jgi:hypothetical protein|nr:hypothetical protein [Thermoanaerobaculia bacterium]
MPKQTIQEMVGSWKRLVANSLANASEVPGLNVQISKLQEVVESVESLSAELDNRLGLRRQSTQERRALLEKGQDLAKQARLVLQAHLGIRNARLVEYGARPLEPRRAKAETTQEKPPEPPTTEAQAPEAKKPEPESPAPAPTAEPTK